MKSGVLNSIELIGQDIHLSRSLRVHSGGILSSWSHPSVQLLQDVEIENERLREKRSETRSWQGASRWKRKACGSRSSRTTSPHISTDLHAVYEKQLMEVEGAYPGTKVCCRDNGMWMLVKSRLIVGLDRYATFLVYLPFDKDLISKAWGFWTTPISQKWIGPRHTNFPDGSICAFEPKDRDWMPGGNIVGLIDLYTAWAFRHLFMEKFNFWPGKQSCQWGYEMLHELNDKEWCGCLKSSGKRYVDCCKPKLLKMCRVATVLAFMRDTKGAERRPPRVITDIVWMVKDPPNEEVI